MKFMEIWTQRVKCKVSDARRASRYLGRDPLRSYFHEPQKNEIHLLCLHFVFTSFFFFFFFITCGILFWMLHISGEEKL